jgi:5-methylcytosine-specific restriction endonuclease McrBC regulatory subunit McrC
LERQKVPLPPHLDTATIRSKLISAATRAGVPGALEIRRTGLYAGGFVGAIDIGLLGVEILPKISSSGNTDDARNFLGDLLRFVGRDQKEFAAAGASIGRGDGSLAEVLYAWALRTVDGNLPSGIPRRYIPVIEASTAVRGRIDMKHVALARPGRDFELVIRHAPLSVNSNVGKAIRWVINEVSVQTRRPATRQLALALLGQLSETADVDADLRLFDGILLKPLEEHWEPLLLFGRSLLAQRSLDPVKSGAAPSIAVLFTLHDLFEGAIRRVLKDYGPHAGLRPTKIPRHLLTASDSSSIVRLKPDYVFAVDGVGATCLAVGDAKWKNIWKLNAPEPSEDDVYQITSYMTAGQAHVGFLFAPLIHEGPIVDPIVMNRFKVSGSGTDFVTIGIHVPTMLEKGRAGEALRTRLCAEIAAVLRSKLSVTVAA